MTVIELDRPWVESPFTVHGFRIKSDDELSLLRDSCKYVYIAVKKKLDTQGERPADAVKSLAAIPYLLVQQRGLVFRGL